MVDPWAYLARDMADEHAAIIQYLQHAWRVGEETGCALEEIARDEMRHLNWLAEAMAEAGQPVRLERSPVAQGEGGIADLLALDVAAEEGAVAAYREQILALGPEHPLTPLLERILADEEHHREEFRRLAEAAGEEAVAVGEPSEGAPWDGLAHEKYRRVLRYLQLAFTAADPALGREMEEQAQVQMRHLGWAGEEWTRSAGRAVIPPEEPPQAPTPAQLAQEALAMPPTAGELGRLMEIHDAFARRRIGALTSPWSVGSLKPK